MAIDPFALYVALYRYVPAPYGEGQIQDKHVFRESEVAKDNLAPNGIYLGSKRGDSEACFWANSDMLCEKLTLTTNGGRTV